MARLVGNNYGCFKSSGEAGRKLSHPELEILLPQWIKEKRDKNERVSLKSIKKKAEALLDQMGSGGPVSQAGIWRMVRRNGFSLRKKSTSNQYLPNDLVPKCQRFVLYMKKFLSVTISAE